MPKIESRDALIEALKPENHIGQSIAIAHRSVTMENQAEARLALDHKLPQEIFPVYKKQI